MFLVPDHISNQQLVIELTVFGRTKHDTGSRSDMLIVRCKLQRTTGAFC